MSDLIYEASVYTRTIKYRNFQGEEKSVTLYFALDPLQLMNLIAGFGTKTSKSGNPALRGKPEPITDEDQLKFLRDLACKAAGTPSDDGESWTPFEGFSDSIAGKAFLTKLTSSDGDRREFAEKVVLDPFRAFAEFAKADPTNTPADMQQFETLMQQMENIFKMPDPTQESADQKRARLAAEMAALDAVNVPVQQGAVAQSYAEQVAAPAQPAVTNAQIPIIN
jgi:hypothetical protein